MKRRNALIWTREQLEQIREFVEEQPFANRRYANNRKSSKKSPSPPPPPPRLTGPEIHLLNANLQAGVDRISGQWVALQHQLGNQPFQPAPQEQPLTSHIKHQGKTCKRERKRQLYLQRAQRDWHARSVGGIFLLYETLPEGADDSPPVTSERVRSNLFIGPREANLSSSWNSFPVWKPEPSSETELELCKPELPAFVPSSSKLMLPGVVPGKSALVYDALYETVKEGWSVQTVERLEKLKSAVQYPHQVCLVLKKLQNNPALALKLFTWAKSILGFRHDVVSYSTMIMILGDDGDVCMAEQLFQELQEVGIQPDTFVINNMIRCYTKVHRIQDALHLYRKMPSFGCQPDNCTFGLLIDWCGKFGGKRELQRLYQDLRATPHKADARTFNMMIYNFTKQRDFTNAMQAAAQMKKWGISFSAATYSTLIRLYGKAEEPQAAEDLYSKYLTSKMEPNLVVYNSAVSSFGTNGLLEKAEQVIRDIEDSGLFPDRFTYCTMISSWGRKGGVQQAKVWFDKATRNALCPSIEMCNALIDGYLKKKTVMPVKELLTTLMPSWGLKPTLQTYNILLSHYTTCMILNSRVVRDLMRETGHAADEFLTSILEGHVVIQELKKRSKKFFQSMRVERPRWARTLVDALVNHLHVFGYVQEALYVWEGACSTELYPRGIWEDWQDSWFIWLQDMSTGTALVALTSGLITSSKRLRRGFERPEKMIIVCGYSSARSKSVTHAVNSTLVALNSPFEPFISLGRFMCEGNLLRDWLLEEHVVRELHPMNCQVREQNSDV